MSDPSFDRQTRATQALMGRFNDVFLQHDPAALDALIAEDCVIEAVGPAPDGARHVGRAACTALWRDIATAPGTRFDLEETFVAGERATIRWRFWRADGSSLRGVNLMRVEQGRIVEAMGYVKAA